VKFPVPTYPLPGTPPEAPTDTIAVPPLHNIGDIMVAVAITGVG